MKNLLKLAFKNSRCLILLAMTVVASIILTVSSQLELVSLGIITKKGPDFFELFAPIQGNKLGYTESITQESLNNRWSELDQNKKGVVDKSDVDLFLAQYKRQDVIAGVIRSIDTVLPIQSDMRCLVFVLVIVALFKAVSMFLYRFCTRLVGIRISRDLRKAYFEHIQALPLSFYQEHNMGSLSSRVVWDATNIADAINAWLVNYLQTPFVLLSVLGFCWIISWQLSVILFLGFPLLVLPIMFLARRIRRISKEIQKKQETFAAVLIDFLGGIQTVKMFAMEEFSLRKYCQQNEQMAELEKRSAKYDISARPILHTIGMLCLVTALLFGLYGLQLPLHEVLLYCGLISTVYEPIKKFAEENGRIQRGIAAAERMTDILSQKPHIVDIDGAAQLSGLEEGIDLDDVYFRYEEDWILKGVSFKVKKGQTVAIVGPTGSGKSTIVQLLPRLYEIQKGQIRIDGKPIEEYSQSSLRENIAFVPQKPFLFLDTIAENICFGRDYSFEEIKQAAVQAHADEFIMNLENGYDTLLAEAGKNLSGGQQQRLAIARALIKKAPILILDEATSALDALSENHIKQVLSSLKGSVTQIIIAHRLSTIEDADLIVFIKNGRKIAEGTKDTLLQTCSEFRAMWNMLHSSAHSHQKITEHN